MSRAVADYVAAAIISRIDWNDDDAFNRVFGSSNDFAGDEAQFQAFAEARCGFPLTNKMVVAAMRTLSECGLLRITNDNYSGTFVKVKPDAFGDFVTRAKDELSVAEKNGGGILDVFSHPSDFPMAHALVKHQVIEDYHELGDEWLKRALIGIRSEYESEGKLPDSDEVAGLAEAGIPASDRIVSVNHNSAEYRNLVEQTTVANEAIRTSNTIGEEDRGWIRDHISLGFELLKKPKILLGAVTVLLLGPLQNAYDAVTEEPARQAILTAINLIRAFFGI